MGTASRGVNRFHVRADTRVTPYAKIRLKTYAQPVLPFGELVLARRPGAHLQKSQTQFVYGWWLGRDSHTDEHIVGSKAGVFRTRTVRRLTEDRSWSTEAVADMEWTPWKTASTTRGRPLLLERGPNPFRTRHYQQYPVHTENHHRDPRHRMPEAHQTNQKCMRYHSWTQMMKLQNALRWTMRHQCRIQGARPPHQ